MIMQFSPPSIARARGLFIVFCRVTAASAAYAVRHACVMIAYYVETLFQPFSQ